MSLNRCGQVTRPEVPEARFLVRLSHAIRLPWACAPNKVVGTVGGGIEVVLLALEFWSSRIVLHLGAYPDARTHALSLDGDAALTEWKKAPTESPPPRDPSIVLIEDMRIDVWTASNERHAFTLCKAGGEDAQWSATWQFTPGYTEAGLAITFTSEAGTTELAILEQRDLDG